MSDILDTIQQEQTAAKNAQLAGAKAKADWSNTFSSIPPEEQLRANRNLNDLVNQAVERRQALAAQGDAKAQELYANTKRFEQWQADAPKRSEKLQAEIDHENALTDASGAVQQFHAKQDAESMAHITGFADYMRDAPEITDPAYHDYVLNGVKQFPRMATTQWGRDVLGTLAKEHDTISNIVQPVAGTRLKSVTRDTSGKSSAVFEPENAAADKINTEGLYDSPDAIWEKFPGATVGQSQTRKGKFYIEKLPSKKESSGLAQDIDQQIKAGTGKPIYFDEKGAKSADATHPATHYRVDYRKKDGTFSPTDVPASEYNKIKAAPDSAVFTSEQEAQAAAKAGKIKAGDKITVAGKTGKWQ